MELSKIPRVSTRPQIKRMSQRELQEIQMNNSFGSPSISSNRWMNRRQSQVAPEINNSWRQNEEASRNLNDNEKKFCLSRAWLWVFGGCFCLILIVAIVGIVLGIVLPMTSNSSSNASATQKMVMVKSEISASIICSDIDYGLITSFTGSISSGWTTYSYNYLAITTAPILVFGFATDDTHVYYLDAISVVDNSALSIELLTNPSFENSTINTTDWITPCETTCTSQIVSGSQCSQSIGNCVMVYCTDNSSSIFFLGQSFMAIIGNTYKISYMLNQAGNSNNSITSFYLNVI